MSNNPYSGAALKRSAGYFLIGKVISALLTFTILLWLVRLLNVSDYAAYITIVATLELTYSTSGIGLPWVEARYLPEFRLHASSKLLSRFIMQLLQCLLLTLLIIAGVAWLNLDWLLLKMDMVAYADAVQLCLVLLVVDGCGRRIRGSMCDALLQQKLGQSITVIRNLLFIVTLAVLVYQQPIDLARVVAAELFASIVSLVCSLVALWRYLTHLTNPDAQADWHAPTWSQMWAVAGNMYLSAMISQVYSPQVFILLIRYHLGADATAVFGFLRNLYTQVTSYLPAALLFGLIRPKLVASYVGNGGIAELTRNANMVGKLSLFVLMPLLVLTWTMSEPLVAQLSGGKFVHSGYYLAGLLCALVPFSQRQILETVAVVTGNSYLCNYASVLGILTLPVTYGLMQLGLGLWGAIIAITLGNLIFCNTILGGVMKKTAYQADFAGFYKMLFSALLGYLACELITPLTPMLGWLWIIGITLLASSAFLLAAAIIKPFSDAERLLINQFLKRRLFIW